MLRLMLALAAQAAAVPAGETRAQAEAKAVALHDAMDTNHDGFVTYEEVRAAARHLVADRDTPVPDTAAARAAFAEADLDGDGRISRAEAVAGADRAFAAADTNGDGVLSAEERGAYAASMVARATAALRDLPVPPCRAGAACDTARRH